MKTDWADLWQQRDLFLEASLATLKMVAFTAVLGGILGLALGILLILTRPGGLKANPLIYGILDKLVNLGRSIPFIILLAVAAPLTRLIVGTAIGTEAVIVPLVLGSAPFYARQVEAALAQVNPGVIEAAQAMGMTDGQILKRVWLPESWPALIRASTLTIIAIIGLTAMAGAVGGGGLGQIAIFNGYNRFRDDITLVATVLILVLVFSVQALGNFLERRQARKTGKQASFRKRVKYKRNQADLEKGSLEI